MIHRPIQMQWIGDSFVPANRYWAGICDKLFVVGQRYGLVEFHERSDASHRHYFAAIAEAWRNLPEAESERYPTPEHLRKTGLIKCGYYNERTFVASSRAEALRIASFVRSIDEYAIITVRNAVITEYTAKSQSYRAMGRKEFGESKNAVLDWCAALCGVSTDELNRNAGLAA